MRLAIVSDVPGNRRAFQAVVADLRPVAHNELGPEALRGNRRVARLLHFSCRQHHKSILDKSRKVLVTYQPFSMPERNTQTQQSAATREGIVSAALRLFAERGFASASIAEIAEAAGITKGAIYWHFDSKDALFKGILDQIRHDWQDVVRTPLERESDPLRKIELLFDRYALLLKQEPEVCLFLQRVLLEPEGDYAKQVARVFDRTQVFVARILEEAKQAGQLESQLDSGIVARTILISLTGVTAHCHASRGLSVDSVVAELKRQVLSRTKRSKD